MDKTQITDYISKNNGVEIPSLQMEFGLSYREAKSVVDEMLNKGLLSYDGGVRYKYEGKTASSDSSSKDDEDEFFRRRAERIAFMRKMFEEEQRKGNEDSEVEDEEEDDDDEADDDLTGVDDADDYGKRFKDYYESRAELEERKAKLLAEIKKRKEELDKQLEAELESEDDDCVDDSEDIDFGDLFADDDEDGEKDEPDDVDDDDEIFDILKGYGFEEDESDDEDSDEDEDDDDEDEDDDVFDALRDYEFNFDDCDVDDDNENVDGKSDIKEEELYSRFMNAVVNPKYESADEFNDDESYYELDEDELDDITQKFNSVVDIVDLNKMAADSYDMPFAQTWKDEAEFEAAVSERVERLVKSDPNMGLHGAIRKAETYLEAVRDTCDNKMLKVYERLVSTMKSMNVYQYAKLKRQYGGEV